MLHMFAPAIEKFTSTSPEWYKQYHSSFYLSQLINNLLLSYVTSFIDTNQLQSPTQEELDELVKMGALKEHIVSGRKKYSKHPTLFYSVDVKIGLNELLNEFKGKREYIKNTLLCTGIGISNDFINRQIDVDLDDLLQKAGESDWFTTIKGFLNVWEFLFIFSITESALKSQVGSNKTSTKELIPAAMEKFPKIAEQLLDRMGITPETATSLWSVFVEIRHLYSHTHGILKESDRKKLIKATELFLSNYENTLREYFPISFLQPEDIFNQDRMNDGKFYFLLDEELNIFRNFITEFMHLLSKETE